MLAHVSPAEILAHRILWSAVITLLLLLMLGRRRELQRAIADSSLLLKLATSAALISSNWLLYIAGVNSGHITEASMGYYLSPLASVACGVLIFHERLRTIRVVAVLCAAAGVSALVISHGEVPWFALGLMLTMTMYSVVRKATKVPSLVGLAIETLLVAPFALAFVAVRESAGAGALTHLDATTTVLLVASGAVTALPLLLFTEAMRRLPLSLIGFFQYISPTIQLILAVHLYGEPFTSVQQLTFLAIWAGLLLVSFDELREFRRRRRTARHVMDVGVGQDRNHTTKSIFKKKNLDS